jgi:hypothetical protein
MILGLFTFLIMGMWEWMQSPFYKDFTDNLNAIVLFRLHCTLGDVIILFEIITILSFIKRTWKWIIDPKKIDYLLVTLMGVIYTLFSEYINVHVRQSWGYSELMPILPFIGAGLIPIMQWFILPTIIITFTKNYMRWYTNPPNKS